MSKTSAGLLMYRKRGENFEVLLVHPGGPFWAKKDSSAWSIPKGEYERGEELLEAAKREFMEETGFTPHGPFTPLTPLTQSGGKRISAWAFPGDCDPTTIRSNVFSMEWPPRSGRRAEFPEVDRAGWFDLKKAAQRIVKGQLGFLEELERLRGKRIL
jgi:predicted NUDIX family NTP pyrophosphohydrolase